LSIEHFSSFIEDSDRGRRSFSGARFQGAAAA